MQSLILNLNQPIEKMSIQFSEAEYLSRRQQVINRLNERGLHGILLFRQESMYYLTGYDTFGYCFFQCLYLGIDGKYALLTRSPDKYQAEVTSTIRDIRVWIDEADKNPAVDLIAMLNDFDCKGKSLAVELHAYGLTAGLWNQISTELSRYCELTDESNLINELRVVKSSAELIYTDRAAKLADDALDEAIRLTAPGAYDGEILAAMHSAIYRGGGDDPANEFILGSGEDALLCRYHTGRRNLSPQDQLTLEFAGVFRHYHACMMRTIVIGKPSARQIAMHKACEEAMLKCQETLKPGAAAGEVFDAHASVVDAHGFHDMRLNACGYSLGATYAPTWMDWPMFYTGNSVVIQPNMVYFLHIILFDSANGLAMTLGETVTVHVDKLVRLSRHSLDLIVK